MVKLLFFAVAVVVVLLIMWFFLVPPKPEGPHNGPHNGHHNGKPPRRKFSSAPDGQFVKFADIGDGRDVTYYLPNVEPTPVTCMSSLDGAPQPDGSCEYSGAYKPFMFEHAYGTNYCDLGPLDLTKQTWSGCNGAIGDPRPTVIAAKAALLSKAPGTEPPPWGPIDENTIFGVTANPPLMIGNSDEGINILTQKPVKFSYQGTTSVSGLCYDVIGPNGGRAILIPGDRCAGYCYDDCNDGHDFNAGDTAVSECGHCVWQGTSAPQPGPPCIGTVPGMYDQCKGMGAYGCEAPVFNECDWCASQNHPHFDMDNDAYNAVCGGTPAPAAAGPVAPAGPIPVYAGVCTDITGAYGNGAGACAQPGAQFNTGGGDICCCPWNAGFDTKTNTCVAGAGAGSGAGAGDLGSCELHKVKPFLCLPSAAPRSPGGGGSTSGTSGAGNVCPATAYDNGGQPCGQAAAQGPGSTPGSTCCCPWGSTYDSVSKSCSAAGGAPIAPSGGGGSPSGGGGGAPSSPSAGAVSCPATAYDNAGAACTQDAAQVNLPGGNTCCCPWGRVYDVQTNSCQ